MVSLKELLEKSKAKQEEKQKEKEQAEKPVAKPAVSTPKTTSTKRKIKLVSDEVEEEKEVEKKPPTSINALLGKEDEKPLPKKKTKEWTIHKMVGEVVGDTIVKNSSGKFAGQHYHDLQVEIKGRPEIKVISAMRSKISDDQIWDDIVSTNYGNRSFTFFCTKRSDKYRLRNWKENKPKFIQTNEEDNNEEEE